MSPEGGRQFKRGALMRAQQALRRYNNDAGTKIRQTKRI